MLKRLECIVEGKVQMVMFRDFVKRNAIKLNLTGRVQNLKNDNVFVLAEGEEDNLNSLIAKLSRGSLFSKVTKLNQKWLEHEGKFKDFQIIYYE